MYKNKLQLDQEWILQVLEENVGDFLYNVSFEKVLSKYSSKSRCNKREIIWTEK